MLLKWFRKFQDKCGAFKASSDLHFSILFNLLLFVYLFVWL